MDAGKARWSGSFRFVTFKVIDQTWSKSFRMVRHRQLGAGEASGGLPTARCLGAGARLRDPHPPGRSSPAAVRRPGLEGRQPQLIRLQTRRRRRGTSLPPWTSAGGRLKPFKSGRPRKPVALRIADPLGRARAERKPQAPSYPTASFGWDKVGQNNPPSLWAGGPHREREVWGPRPPGASRWTPPHRGPLDRLARGARGVGSYQRAALSSPPGVPKSGEPCGIAEQKRPSHGLLPEQPR